MNVALLVTVLVLLISWTSKAVPTSRITVIPNPVTKSSDGNDDNSNISYTNPNLRGSLVESMIRKTSFSNTNRLLIVAGLEGTGHHAFTTMFDVCINVTISNVTSTKGRCRPVPELTSTLMFNNATRRVGLFFANDAANAGIYLKTIKKMMASLNKPTDNDNNIPTLYIIGIDHPTTSGMLSYPNFGDPQKTLNHPDIAVLARIAELVNLDFRVVVLQRSADSILMSTQNRRFGGPREGRILSDSAAALYSQLKLLDPRFFYCIQYHDLSTLSDDKKRELIDFTHPIVIQSLLPQMLKLVHSKPQITTSHDFINNMKNRSQNKNNQDYYSEMKKYITGNYDLHGVAARLQLIDNLCIRN